MRTISIGLDTDDGQTFFTLAEVAVIMKKGTDATIRNYIKNGELACVKLGGRKMVPSKALDNFLTRKKAKVKRVKRSE